MDTLFDAFADTVKVTLRGPQSGATMQATVQTVGRDARGKIYAMTFEVDPKSAELLPRDNRTRAWPPSPEAQSLITAIAQSLGAQPEDIVISPDRPSDTEGPR